MSSLEFADRKYLKRRDAGNEHFWQFQFELDPIKESKAFNDKKYGSKQKSYEAAIHYRDEFLAAAHELGYLGPDGSLSRSELPVVLALSPRNTSGIVGLYRENLIRKDRRKPEVAWVAGYKDDERKNAQRSFHVGKLGEKEALHQALKFRRDYVARVGAGVNVAAKRELIERHVQDLDFLLEYIAELEDESDLFFFLSTINNPLISATEKQDILSVRIGQARFRKIVLGMSGHKCHVTGSTQLLTASHIRPWSESDDSERVDPYNGLALSPVFDKAFDVGLITFQQNGGIVLSPLLALNAALLGITGKEQLRGLTEHHHKYLEYHRRIRFQHGAK